MTQRITGALNVWKVTTCIIGGAMSNVRLICMAMTPVESVKNVWTTVIFVIPWTLATNVKKHTIGLILLNNVSLKPTCSTEIGPTCLLSLPTSLIIWLPFIWEQQQVLWCLEK